MAKKILLGLCLLTSCATNTGVMQTAVDTYTISVERQSMLGGRSVAHKIAYRDANNYCKNQAKVIQIISMNSFHNNSIVPDTGIDLIFSCVSPVLDKSIDRTYHIQ